jgi:transposase
MPRIVRIELSQSQKQELEKTRDHAQAAYLRERAAAILKVANGQTITEVAAQGLLKSRKHETLRTWLKRYLEQGLAGLKIKSGRGRKAAFFPQEPQGSPKRAP